jgi:hypothetical protein
LPDAVTVRYAVPNIASDTGLSPFLRISATKDLPRQGRDQAPGTPPEHLE